MAFITKETVKDIREALKKEFPEIKFSIRKEHHSSVSVAIMKSPYFDDDINRSINHYWIKESTDNEEQASVIQRIDEIIRKTGDYFDESDSMTDYFHCAFYYDIQVGKWDKNHVKVG